MEGKLPEVVQQFAEKYPAVWDAYNQLGEVSAQAGPLDQKTQRFVKLGIAIGARLEGAVHSHARRALEEGITTDELYHVAILAITTVGFSSATAARTWIADVIEPQAK